MSVALVISRVQALWEDQNESWCDKDYVQTFLAIHNEDVESLLESLDLSYDTKVILISAVPAGTSDLSAYQGDGQPLDNMMLPTALEWRLVGQDDSQWQVISRLDKVRDTILGSTGTPSNTTGIASYEWRSGIIYITPSSADCDIRVRCETLPAVLDSDSTVYIKGLTNVLSYGVAAIIAFVRGGPSSKIGMWFQSKADDALETVSDRMVKDEQVISRRMGGRRSGMQGMRWKMPGL